MKYSLAALVALVALVSCAPRANFDPSVTVTPVIYQLSPVKDNQVVVQGRFLGSEGNGKIKINANEAGDGGMYVPSENIVLWTENKIVFTTPKAAKPGGSWVYVEAGGRRSTGLMINIPGK